MCWVLQPQIYPQRKTKVPRYDKSTVHARLWSCRRGARGAWPRQLSEVLQPRMPRPEAVSLDGLFVSIGTDAVGDEVDTIRSDNGTRWYCLKNVSPSGFVDSTARVVDVLCGCQLAAPSVMRPPDVLRRVWALFLMTDGQTLDLSLVVVVSERSWFHLGCRCPAWVCPIISGTRRLAAGHLQSKCSK